MKAEIELLILLNCKKGAGDPCHSLSVQGVIVLYSDIGICFCVFFFPPPNKLSGGEKKILDSRESSKHIFYTQDHFISHRMDGSKLNEQVRLEV